MGYDLDAAHGYWLHLAFNRLRSETVQFLNREGYDLTPEQWAVMVRLWERDLRNQTELAEATFRDKASVTRMLDALTRQGYVERQPNPRDRRAFLIALTDAGRALEDELVPKVRDFVAWAFRDIDADELARFQQTLRKLYNNLT